MPPSWSLFLLSPYDCRHTLWGSAPLDSSCLVRGKVQHHPSCHGMKYLEDVSQACQSTSESR